MDKYNIIYIKMKVIVKDLKQNSHEFDDVELTQSVSEFAQLVKKEFKYTDGVRLIYCGRILESDKLMSEYFKDNNSGFVVCMPEKTKPTNTHPVNTQPVNTHPVNTHPVNTQPVITHPVNTSALSVMPDVTVTSTTSITRPSTTPTRLPTASAMNITQTYTAEQVRATIMVFTRMLKVSPELFYMFSTNDASFQEFMLSSTFQNDILKHLLEHSNNVANAIQNGEDLAVPIPIYGRRGNTHSNSVTTPQNIFTPDIIDNMTDSGDNDENTENLFSTNTTMPDSTVLSETDKQNIQDLCQLGFPENIVTQTYILTNKNKELTASMLFEFA
jgi:hypothetical protein